MKCYRLNYIVRLKAEPPTAAPARPPCGTPTLQQRLKQNGNEYKIGQQSRAARLVYRRLSESKMCISGTQKWHAPDAEAAHTQHALSCERICRALRDGTAAPKLEAGAVSGSAAISQLRLM